MHPLHLPRAVVLFATVLSVVGGAATRLCADEPKSTTTKPADGKAAAETPVEAKLRPTEPPAPPDPDELDARPGADGKIRFNFRGQPWPDVLNWLADVSEMSFDWQELPGDYLNLTTQRGYSVEEARDLINRHLLARGYTMLESDELLTVVNVKKLDSGMVPRVEPQELAKRRPHEFVKVSFPLEWLVADSAVEELKPMLSPNGKLVSLKSTNRMEAMDAVVNLREIYKVIGQEQSDVSQERLVREFDLQFAKAAEVQQQLQKLLGIEEKQPSGSTSRMSSEEIQRMVQQQAEIVAQRASKSGHSLNAPKNEVSLVVNPRRNSVLARATPDKMAVIEQAIRMLDVAGENTQTIQGSVGRMQVYRLSGLDPLAIVKTLEESGGLDPTTRLQVDEKNKAIIVHASLADHMLIRQVVEKLDGSGRAFEVVQLRKLGAEFVAGTIEFMLGAGEEKQTQRSPYYGYDSSRRSDAKETADKFRVDADIENNRLLLWANEIELEEVRNLLIKLGEIPDRRAGASKVRVLSVQPGAEAEELLDRLRSAWPDVAPNPLVLPPKSAKKPVEKPAPPVVPATPAAKSAQTPAERRPWQQFVQLAQFQAGGRPGAAERDANTDERRQAGDEPATPARGAAAPAVKIEYGPDGRLVISSQDTEALDRLEELAEQLAPERRDYQVFVLKHAPAYWVKLNLAEFFEEEDKSKSDNRSRILYYYDFGGGNDKKDTRQRLSKKKPLRFIADGDTNTIVVIGADAQQLKTIAELVELYDRPEPNDAKSARMTSVVPVQWSQASVVAEAVKEVYRDLLSSNDKSLQQANPRARPTTEGSYIAGGANDDKEKRTQVTFKGKLSIGIDELSNTLLVSADGENLLNNVVKMIESLDEAARPSSTIQVLKVGGGMNTGEVKKLLSGLLNGESTTGAKSATPTAAARTAPTSSGSSRRSRSSSGGR